MQKTRWVPDKHDRAFHIPTNTSFVVASRAKSEDGRIWLYDRPRRQGNAYRLEECQPPPLSRLYVGQRAVWKRAGFSDELVEVIGMTPASEGGKVCVIPLDGDACEVVVSETALVAAEDARELNESEVETLIDMAAAIVSSGNPEELEILSHLTIAHRQQLWDVLTPELQQGLKKLREVAA